MRRVKIFVTSAAMILSAILLPAQEPNPSQRTSAAGSQPQTVTPAPIFRIEVISHTIAAINYLHRGGSTKVDFQSTPLMPAATGEAKVESERGVIRVQADFKRLSPPSSFGPEYLTYVLWAISPDGRPVNLGELTLSDYGRGSDSKIEATSDIQTFGMIVTAEPYYGVTQPSDVVVLENTVRPDTRGVKEEINARYELLPRGVYTIQGKARGFTPIIVGKKDPFELYEAENAVQLARVAAADKYAADSFNQAVKALAQAHQYQARRPGQKPVITMAREAVVRAEDARVIALRRQRDEAEAARLNAEKQKAETARLKAEEETRQRAQADALRAQAETQRKRAEAQRTQAEADRAAADRAKAEALAAAQAAERERAAAELAKRQAEEARQAALVEQRQLAADAERARQAASDADRRRVEAEQKQSELRQQLLIQFNQILQTRETARGLIVNMSDVLFETGRYELKPGAREELAKVAGIILAHPGLKIEVEGHTDSVGGDEYNMKLSENRANAVRMYLLEQGLNNGSLTARGFGKTKPVADNATAAGRQRNRRVELVVSGEILGSPVVE